jgi:thioredoxin 1
MTPVFKEVEKEFLNKVKFLELNVDQARDLAINFGITSIPTIIFIKDGKIVSKETGYMDAKTLTSAIEQFIKQA